MKHAMKIAFHHGEYFSKENSHVCSIVSAGPARLA
jgi:hypothetical protein